MKWIICVLFMVACGDNATPDPPAHDVVIEYPGGPPDLLNAAQEPQP
jgi:hypothetical protein